MFKISEGEAEHITSPLQTLTRYVSLVTTYNTAALYYICKQQASYNAQFTSFTNSVLLAVKAIFSVNQLTL